MRKKMTLVLSSARMIAAAVGAPHGANAAENTKLDILGVHIGADLNSAIDAVKAHNPKAKVSILTTDRYGRIDGKGMINAVEFFEPIETIGRRT